MMDILIETHDRDLNAVIHLEKYARFLVVLMIDLQFSQGQKSIRY